MPQVVVSWIAGAIMTMFPTIAGGIATATAIAQFGVALVMSALSSALTKEQQPNVKRQLAQVTERPIYRTVYGWDRAVGTPAPRRVFGDKVVGCYILNSRRSYLPAGTTKVFFDDRDIKWSGTPFDFNSDGGLPTEHVAGLARFWIGRGDQTSPPAQIVSRFPNAQHIDYGFLPTDAWRGITVLWAIFDAGDDEEFQENWPSNSPSVSVEGQWSYVWNPNDATQSPTDESTWKWDDNQPMCVLDALRNNPVAPYTDELLILDDYRRAIPRARSSVLKKDGTSEPMYRVGGTITWSADKEIEDQLDPLMLAGAASFVRVGGRLGFRLGVWTPPTRTIRDIVGNEFEFSPAQSAVEVPTEIRVSYMSRDRGYEPADLAPIVVPGAKARNGGMEKVQSVALTMVTSATQAMRIKRILWHEALRARNATVGYPAAGFALSIGEYHNVALPSGPLARLLNGTYELTEIAPLIAEDKESGGAFLTSRVLIKEIKPAMFNDWTPAMEEDVKVPSFNENIKFNPAGSIPTMGYEVGPQFDINSGGTVVSRARIWFVPEKLNGVRFQWEHRVGSGEWESGGALNSITPDAQGRLHYFIELEPGKVHSTRVRAINTSFFLRYGPFTELTGIMAGFSLSSLTVTAPAGTPGRLTVSGTAPGIAYATRVRLYRGAFAVGGLKAVDPGEPFTVNWDGLAAGSANFYVTPVSTTGVEGTRNGPYTRTIS